MPVYVNRAQVYTATTGTGTITLGSAVPGYQTFASAGLLNGEIVSYAIEDGTAWEVGVGTYNSTGPTLTRSVTQSSTGALLNLSGVDVKVYVTVRAQDIQPVGGGHDQVFYENGQTVTSDYTITSGKNAISAGPITVNSGVTVTVPSGSNWVVL